MILISLFSHLYPEKLETFIDSSAAFCTGFNIFSTMGLFTPSGGCQNRERRERERERPLHGTKLNNLDLCPLTVQDIRISCYDIGYKIPTYRM